MLSCAFIFASKHYKWSVCLIIYMVMSLFYYSYTSRSFLCIDAFVPLVFFLVFMNAFKLSGTADGNMSAWLNWAHLYD